MVCHFRDFGGASGGGAIVAAALVICVMNPAMSSVRS